MRRCCRLLVLVCGWGLLASAVWAREPPSAPAEPAGAPRAARNQDPSTLIADTRFRRNWRLLLGAHSREPWLAQMNGPAPQPRWVTTGSGRFVLHAFCKPHDCHDNNAVLLYNPYDGRIHGLVHRAGGGMLVGDPPPQVAAELQRLWRKEWRPPSK